MKISKKWIVALVAMGGPALNAPAQQPKDWQFEVGANATEAHARWQQLTRGEELARGRKVQFFPPPNYRLTTDENDPYELTDGTLTSRADDRVWFNKDAVGWYHGVGTTGGVLMVIDLGSLQSIGQIAIRVLGGREQGALELPAAVEFLASADGKGYYSLQKMVKLNPAEQEQADFKTGFFIPEEGKAFMVPLVSREAVRARFVALRIRPQSSLFADQISILKAPDSAALRNLESFPKAQVYTEGLVVMPRHNSLVVTTNVTTPNWLTVMDNSGLDPARSRAAFRLELPHGLRVLPSSAPVFKEVLPRKPEVNAYEFSYDATKSGGTIGPLWIETVAGISVPAGAKARFTGFLQGQESHSVESPIQLVAVPEVLPGTSFDISLAWLFDAQQQNWPNFLRDFRKMGFGSVSTFPRYFGKDKAGNWNEAAQKNLDFLQEARRAGYGVVYNESPFHVMWQRVQADHKAGKIDAGEAEPLFTQLNGQSGKQMNILYRGKYFQDEIKRVAELAALVQPDHVYLDIEWWDASAAESKKDPRVLAVWKQSGKEWDDFVTDIGAEALGTLVTAMRQAVPGKKMVVGTYNSDPRNRIYNSIFQFDKIYPQIVDIAQPSLYVQGRAQLVAERIRFDYNAMQKREIVPWLSAGTYGEFDPAKMEPMVLEAILNGSRGITYYKFGDFDPMDFYYHARALAMLAPFEKLLQSGKPVAYQGDNPDLHYTAFASHNEALLLVGNYGGSPNGNVNLTMPFKSLNSAQSNGKTLSINGGTLSLNVPPGEHRLIFLTQS